MTKAEAMQEFWSLFGLPAYEESCVPAGAEQPYLTYEFVSGASMDECAMYATLWYRSGSWVEVNRLTEDISHVLGCGGLLLACDDGRLWVRRGEPFAESVREKNDSGIRKKRVRILVAFLTNG